MQNREEVELSEHYLRSLLDEEYEGYIEDEEFEYEYIQDDVSYVDLDKSYEDHEVVIKRTSDGKYFKFGYSSSSYHDIFSEGMGWDGFPAKAEEVFPRTIEVIVYD